MAIENENLNNDHGFVRKPYARRKIIMDANGKQRVVYVDMKTGREVNPQGYQVIETDNTVDTTQVTPTSNPTVTADPNNPQTKDKSVASQFVDHTTEANTAGGPTNSAIGGNYGYYNKPGWMGFTGMIPGPLGLAGKLGNAAINASNTQAVNEQRAALGMEPNSVAKNIGSTVFDQKGYIGDVSQKTPDGTTNTTPVGFEATDKYNRTTYTPEEARRHELLAGAKPATEDEKQQAIGSFQGQFPEQGGFFSKLQESAKGLFGSIFGSTTDQNTTNNINGSTSSVSVDSHGFPSAPDKPKESNNSADNSPDDRDNPSVGTNTGGVDVSHFSPGLF